MSWLARVFWYIADFFWDLRVLFNNIAYTCEDIPFVGDALYNLFKNVAYFFWDLTFGFYDISDEIDNWWDWISGLWSELSWLWEWADEIWERVRAVIWNLPDIFGFSFSTVFDVVDMFVHTIGTRISDFVAWVKENAEVIYQTINEYITNVYQTFNEYITNIYETISTYITNVYENVYNYITNVYETVQNIFNTYITEIIGVTEGWVGDFVNAALAPFIAPINLVNLWFDAIQDFFNDPLEWLWSKFTNWFLGTE